MTTDDADLSLEQGSPHSLPTAHRGRPDGVFDATLITFAAMALFDGLDPAQREAVLAAQADSGRSHWNFLPESGRTGLPLKALSHEQLIQAHRLIAQSISTEAYARVVQVITLEHVLREINLPLLGHVARDFRDPGMYLLTLFGQPQPDSVWGWRLVGHHLSLNVTVIGQDVVSLTPFLLGAEPGRFGPFRVLGEEEDAGFALLAELDADQLTRAIIHDKPPADFVTRTVPVIGDVEAPDYHGVGRRDAAITDVDRLALRYFRSHPRGIAARGLGATQRARFDELLQCFISRARPQQIGFEMDRIRAAGGVDDLHFAWAGQPRIDQPHYFRIQGQATLIEFDNAEDNANHVHSVWRDPSNDFGNDLLMQHLAQDHGLGRSDAADREGRA
jgi:uncharacterized protein DUF3500